MLRNRCPRSWQRQDGAHRSPEGAGLVSRLWEGLSVVICPAVPETHPGRGQGQGQRSRLTSSICPSPGPLELKPQTCSSPVHSSPCPGHSPSWAGPWARGASPSPLDSVLQPPASLSSATATSRWCLHSCAEQGVTGSSLLASWWAVCARQAPTSLLCVGIFGAMVVALF